MKILVDTSIISSLAKIGRLGMLRKFGTVYTTYGVVHEALNSHIESIEHGIEDSLDKWLKM